MNIYEHKITFETIDSETITNTRRMKVVRPAPSAESTVVYIDDLKGNNFKKLLNVSLNDLYTNEEFSIDEVNLSLTRKELESLKVGIHEIEVTYNDEKVIVYLAVYDDTSMIDNGKILFIDKLENIYLEEELKIITQEQIIKDYGAGAFIIATGEEVEVYVKNKDVLNNIHLAQNDSYELILKANPEIKITMRKSFTETGILSYLYFIILILLLAIVTRVYFQRRFNR